MREARTSDAAGDGEARVQPVLTQPRSPPSPEGWRVGQRRTTPTGGQPVTHKDDTMKITLKVNTYVLISGCPENPIGALDFRAQNGLPPRGDNHHPVVYDDEINLHDLRRLVGAGYRTTTTADGDVSIELADGAFGWRGWPMVETGCSTNEKTHHGAPYGWRAEVPAYVLRRGIVEDILVEIAGDSPAKRRQRAERLRRAEAARVALQEAETAVAACRAALAALTTEEEGQQ